MSELNKSDVAFLKSLPRTLPNFEKHRVGHQNSSTRRLLKQVKRLWAARYIKGEVRENGYSFFVVLQDKGREALARVKR